MKFRARWYNQDSVVESIHDDELIDAPNTEEATKLAYILENGNPPALMLFLEEVK